MPKKSQYGFPGLRQKHGKFVYQPPMMHGIRPKLIHLSTEDFSEAVKLASEIRQRQFFRKHVEPMADLVEAFLHAKAAEGDHKSAITTHAARASLKRFQGFFKCQPGEITPGRIRAWKADMLSDGLSRASVAGYMRYSQSFCSWLCREGKLLRNPFQNQKGLFPKSIPTRRERVCDKATRNRLINNCDYLPLKAVLFIGFYAGLRRNEILNIRPEWILKDSEGRPTHFRIQNEMHESGGIAFHTKDSEAKTVPISDPLADFLQKEFGMDHDPFLIRPDLTQRSYKYRWEWKRRWKTYMTQQKVPWVSVHTMRHTWFTLLLSGSPAKRPTLLHLERWSGTSVDTIKKHYAHLFEDRDLINAAN